MPVTPSVASVARRLRARRSDGRRWAARERGGRSDMGPSCAMPRGSGGGRRPLAPADVAASAVFAVLAVRSGLVGRRGGFGRGAGGQQRGERQEQNGDDGL